MATIKLNASPALAAQLGYTQLRSWLTPSRPERSALSAATAVALTIASVIAVLAQQPPPQTPASPPAPAPPTPPSAAPPSPTPSAPSPAVVDWQKALLARLAQFQRYPAQARGAEGVVTVGFTIDRQGKIVSSRIVKSSGSTILDAEALALLKRAAPLPPPPAEVTDAALSFVLPVRFAAG